MQWRTETREANTHMHAQQKTHTSQQAEGGCVEQVRAAVRSHLGVTLGWCRGVERRVERVERRSVHQRVGEQAGEVGEGRGR
jgi:hypothetical protein